MEEMIKQVDEMLELRDRLRIQEKKLGMDCGVGLMGRVLVYSYETFAEMAVCLKEKVLLELYPGHELPVSLKFRYKDVVFVTSMTAEQHNELVEKYDIYGRGAHCE